MKKLISILAPLAFGISLLPTNLNAQKISFTERLEFELKYENFSRKIGNIPLAIRDVSKHPEDGYANDNNVAPIKDNEYNINNELFFVSFKTGVKIPLSKKKITIKFNEFYGSISKEKASIKFGVGFETGPREIAFEERNYTNSPGTDKRGYGAALTFYEIMPRYVFKRNKIVRPRAFYEIEFMVSKRTSLSLGYDVFNEMLVARNGWDRNNAYQTKDRYTLSNMYIGEANFSLRNYRMDGLQRSLNFGLINLISNKNTELGNQAKAKPSKIGFSVGASINLSPLFEK